MGEVATPHSGSQKLEEQLGNAKSESQSNITGILLSGMYTYLCIYIYLIT
jgi:hypothetical protein